METETQGMAPASNSGHITRLAALVLVLVVIAGGYWYYMSRKAVVPKVNEAVKGQFAESFPQELIFEKGITLERSYQVSFPDGSVQSNATYVSRGSIQYNIALIHSSLTEKGWAISHDGNIYDKPSVFFSADKPQQQLSISFAQSAKGIVTVAITHLQTK